MNKEITSLKNNSELKRELKKFRDMKNHLNNMNSSKKLSNILTPSFFFFFKILTKINIKEH